MADVLLTHEDGSVSRRRFHADDDRLFASHLGLVAIGGDVAQLTCVKWVNVPGNALSVVPSGYCPPESTRNNSPVPSRRLVSSWQ